MIDAKDVSRKISGCTHNPPVRVPCHDCIEAQMKNWESYIRDDAKALMRENWARLNSELSAAKAKNAPLIELVESLKSKIAKLECDNQSLRYTVKANRHEIDDLKLCLDTERKEASRKAS